MKSEVKLSKILNGFWEAHQKEFIALMKLSKVTELITEFLPLMLKDWKENLFPSKKSHHTKILKKR
jgi:hypothetical protein